MIVDGIGGRPVRTIGSLEELQHLKGQEIGVSDWLTVDQELITSFGKLTGDEHWIHMDAERCRRESPFGGTIAHGALTLSLMTQLLQKVVQFSGQLPRTMSYGFNRVRFPAPVPSGSRVRLRVSLTAIEEFAGGVQMTWNIGIETENSTKPSLVADWISRTYFFGA
jgi:acyl dehydratase